MCNLLTKAILHGHRGPLSASKITLEYKDCKTTYRIGHFTDKRGYNFYPKGIQSPLIEGSNRAKFLHVDTKPRVSVISLKIHVSEIINRCQNDAIIERCYY